LVESLFASSGRRDASNARPLRQPNVQIPA
jgi:hypothetical protein